MVSAVERQDAVHLGRLWRHVRESLDERLLIERQHRIPALFERERARRFSAQACAADRAGEVARIDFEIVRERQQLVVKARVQLRGILTSAARQVGSANSTYE